MPSVLGKRVSQKEYDRLTAKNKATPKKKKPGVRSVDLSSKARQVLNRPRKSSSNQLTSTSGAVTPQATNVPGVSIPQNMQAAFDVPMREGNLAQETGAVAPLPEQDPNLLQRAGQVLTQPLPGMEDVQAGAPLAPIAPAGGKILTSAAKGINSANTANKLAKLGNAADDALKVGTVPNSVKATTTAEAIATNTKSIKKTKDFFNKISKHAGTAAAALAALGSYPWAGHLAFDNVVGGYSIGIRDAREAGLEEEAQMLQDSLDDFLSPSFEEKVLYSVPFANVAKVIAEGFKQARLVNSVYRKIGEDIQQKNESGESDDEFYARIAEEREVAAEEEREKDNAAYAEYLRLKGIAEQEGRDADVKYWDEVLARQEESLRRKKQIELDYWSNYYKILAESRDDNTPSKLNFGLI